MVVKKERLSLAGGEKALLESSRPPWYTHTSSWNISNLRTREGAGYHEGGGGALQHLKPALEGGGGASRGRGWGITREGAGLSHPHSLLPLHSHALTPPLLTARPIHHHPHTLTPSLLNIFTPSHPHPSISLHLCIPTSQISPLPPSLPHTPTHQHPHTPAPQHIHTRTPQHPHALTPLHSHSSCFCMVL